MKPIARLTAYAVAVALSLAGAPLSSHAGAAAAPTAKTCFFVRNHLPCPCPRGQQVRAVGHALGIAIGKTAVALARADHNHDARANSRHASQPAPPSKR